jgi:hypothetical protein
MKRFLVSLVLLVACSSSNSNPGTGGHGGTGGAAGTAAGSGGSGGNPSGAAGSGGSASGGTTGTGAAAGSGGGGGVPTNDANGADTGGGDASDTGPASEAGGCGASLSDDFSGAQVNSCWMLLNGTAGNPLIVTSVAGGALHLRAMGNQNGVWFQGSTKSLMYKVITARNFKVTTTAHPRKATAATALPTKDLHVGGLMVRNPSSAGGATENYLFAMVGHSENNNGTVHQGIEFKSTVGGCSNWNEPDWGNQADAPDAQLRICRLGADFRVYNRVPGTAAWTPAPPPMGCAGNMVQTGVLTRNDLPDTLQIGLGLNFSSPSDLDVAFDSFDFVALPAGAGPPDCTTD